RNPRSRVREGYYFDGVGCSYPLSSSTRARLAAPQRDIMERFAARHRAPTAACIRSFRGSGFEPRSLMGWSTPVAACARPKLACDIPLVRMEMEVTRRLPQSLTSALATAALVLSNLPVQAHDADAHAHHHHAPSETTRSIVEYTIPDVKLVRD